MTASVVRVQNAGRISRTAVPVRRIPGPFVLRVCLREGNGFRWVESVRRPLGQYLDVAALSTLRPALPAGRAVPLIPTTLGRRTTVWPLLPTPNLLCDGLFSVAAADPSWGCRALADLGDFLGALHADMAEGSELDETMDVLPERVRPAWLSRDQEAEAGVRAARGRLPLAGCGALVEDANGAAEPAAHKTRVHGRFSTGVVAAVTPIGIMGWREAGLGDPLRDVAYLLSECVEAGSLTGDDPASAAPRIQAFLGAYAQRRGAWDVARLQTLVADRILEHYAQGVWAFGHADRVAPVLEAVDRGWRILRLILVGV